MSEDNSDHKKMEDKKAEPKNPVEIIDKMISSYDAIQEKSFEMAIIAGEEKERLQIIRPAWEDMSKREMVDPDEAEVYGSAISTLDAYCGELTECNQKTFDLSSSFRDTVRSSDSVVTITAGTMAVMSFGPTQLPEEVTLPRHSQFEETREKLKELDEALSDTYTSIREVRYGTRSDPERAAFYQTRQVFDHFFSLLAPDDLVRQSSYWSPKLKPDDPCLITRFERVMFAAHTHVPDHQKRDTLISSARHMIAVYKSMNEAHKRGRLEADRARAALREVLTLIETWVSAIKLPLSFLTPSD